MSTDSDPVLAVAIRAARTAGSILVDAARDLVHLPTFSKEHARIVSGADMEAEDAIIATLRGAFPEHAILGEESGHIAGAREGGGYRWLVDPIDGSANFIHGYPAYATSLALVHGTLAAESGIRRRLPGGGGLALTAVVCLLAGAGLTAASWVLATRWV